MPSHAVATKAEAAPRPRGGRLPFQEVVARYQSSDRRKALLQIADSFLPFFALQGLAVWAMGVSFWAALPLILLSAGFLVRVFIIQHDCGHGSFFRSSRANDLIGTICGFFTLTPYYQWRHEHAVHHATSGDLDRRGTGDITLLTVDEYLSRTPFQRWLYRAYRHPAILFGFGPIFQFMLSFRFVTKGLPGRARKSVYLTNAALLAIAVGGGLAFGFGTWISIQLLTMYFAGMGGIWLFYIQHVYDGVYFAPHEDWDYGTAALQGSSYYKLPKVLQFFSGNIGFHHIHHLSARVPNYRLEACHNDPDFTPGGVTTLTLRSSLKTVRLALWDEAQGRMIAFHEVRRLRAVT